MKKQWAAIFDMDGVIVDNFRFHQQAWSIFCERYGLDFDRAFRSSVFGGTNRDHLQTFFGRELNSAEVAAYEAEKESLYRKLYKDHISPVSGILRFLEELTAREVPLALATSSPAVNVRFVLQNTLTKGYFRQVIDAGGVNKGKPDPEIYLKSAAALGLDPGKCVVFEDSHNGITAAKRAGMRVVALSTTHPEEQLPPVDLVIPDFETVRVRDIEILL